MSSDQTLPEFLLACIAEDEALVAGDFRHDEPSEGIVYGDVGAIDDVLMISPARVEAECKAKRQIVEFHQAWPVLVQTPAELTRDLTGGDIDSMVFRLSQRMDWLTAQQFRDRFGDEPPTAPMLAALATVYADRAGYRTEWSA